MFFNAAHGQAGMSSRLVLVAREPSSDKHMEDHFDTLHCHRQAH